uniref:ShKT domain-containing protein n=1 Tax=Romanomermis culicivorax TaxID=13658 RepID=A0A915KF09_ROMCU
MTRQNRWQRENDYPTGRETCGAICQSDQQMRPFPMRIIDALSNAYTDYLYDYGKRLTCSYAYPHCGSKYLFCDRTKNRCLSKIKMNGNCQGFEGYDCCYDGRCINGRCYPNPPTTTTTTEVATPPPKPPRFSFPGDSTSNTVWFPITILSLTFDGTIREYKEARVVTKDLETGQQVRAAVEVTGRSTKCSGYCLMHGHLLYVPCEPAIIKLGKNTEKRDVLFATSHQSITDMQWQGQKRVPDKFLFLCSSSASEERHSVASIAVQDLDEKKFSERSCLDNHRCCRVWQLPVVDRCQSVVWLKKACPRSCHVCGDGASDKESNDECSDFSSQCPKWAAEKQCQLNSHWMEENCRRSCNVCQRSGDQLRALCKDDSSVTRMKEPKKECKDLHIHCPAWSQTGECQKNSQWMTQNCPKSCKICA